MTARNDDEPAPGGGGEASQESEADPVVAARRRLLKLTVYGAPAVIGTLLVSRRAMAQGSCGPSTCGPTCSPNGFPCQPDNCNPRN